MSLSLNFCLNLNKYIKDCIWIIQYIQSIVKQTKTISFRQLHNGIFEASISSSSHKSCSNNVEQFGFSYRCTHTWRPRQWYYYLSSDSWHTLKDSSVWLIEMTAFIPPKKISKFCNENTFLKSNYLLEKPHYLYCSMFSHPTALYVVQLFFS